MERVFSWCTKNWIWILVGVGYIALMAAVWKPGKRFFGVHESEQ